MVRVVDSGFHQEDAAVSAGVFTWLRATGGSLKQQTFLFLGAGEAAHKQHVGARSDPVFITQ
jgi:hypothetical protein